MPTDYLGIAEQNRLDYGRKIDRVGKKIISSLYSERTHFVFELLQNAEDALRKRHGDGPHSVQFELRRDGLLLSHFGKPFDEFDIRGVCGIDESTKAEDLNSIGRFGIGFKSVFAITDRPEVRSGDESFAIDSYVLPLAIPPREAEPNQTVFWFPFGESKEEAFEEIAECLSGLRGRTLMFLREVRDVFWSVEGGVSGAFCRESETLSQRVRRVTLMEQQAGGEIVEESWLVFSRPVFLDGAEVGAIEIAYLLVRDTESAAESICPVADSKLVAFFPTNVTTRLGFLLQAPFRTTPARDNVPPKDEWNRRLINESGELLAGSLDELKSMGLLSVEALGALPLVREQFAGTMFEPLFEAVRNVLSERSFLPTNSAQWVSARQATIARGQELRELVDPNQLTDLFGQGERLMWLSDSITQDRTPVLRNYLMREHDVREVTPEGVLSRITKAFLEGQSDEWVRRLYGFLNGQRSLMSSPSLKNKPWVRLQDGTHVAAYDGEQPNAFLPSNRGKSGFPTIRAEVCRDEEALEFLKGLKLAEPDPVDDVATNILPLYGDFEERPNLEAYHVHLETILSAFETQRLDQRSKLVSALRSCRWVIAHDNAGNQTWRRASECYLPTDRLTRLFENVPGIIFVDTAVAGLQGRDARAALIACGASQYLETEAVNELTWDEKREIWKAAGYEHSHDLPSYDSTVRGLILLLSAIDDLDFDSASERARLLWDALADMVQDKRERVVRGTYRWFRHTERQFEHDAAFIRRLQKAEWIPQKGSLVCPMEAVFEEIEPAWNPNAVLQAALKFKPPIIAMLASQLGVDREAVMALADATLEEIAELKAMVAARRNASSSSGADSTDQSDGQSSSETGTQPNPSGNTRNGAGHHRGGGGGTGGARQHGESRDGEGQNHQAGRGSQAGMRPFISYVATRPIDEQDEDVSDSNSQEERMRVEALAIDHILQIESDLQRTPAGNPGFDLYGTDSEGVTNKWVEVKAMVGTLDSHPVTMSRRQFLTAQERGDTFWLYVVELATSEAPRILRIQDPAGNARSFTFDHGWRDIARLIQIDLITGEVVDQREEVVVS